MKTTRRSHKTQLIDDIKFDVNGLKQRKPVSTILDSQLFRQELETITQSHAKSSTNFPIKAKPSDNPITTLDLSTIAFHRFYPISDISGRNNLGLETNEKILRRKLASVFRLIDVLGWKQSQGTLLTARINLDDNKYLANPFGLSYQEISARKLIKIDDDGQLLDSSQLDHNFTIDQSQYSIHQYIYSAKPGTRCVIHLRTPHTLAVSATRIGLLPLCQEATEIYPQYIFQYNPMKPNLDDKERFIREFSQSPSRIVVLQNNGFLVTGSSVEEGFYNSIRVMVACNVQSRCISAGLDNLEQISMQKELSNEYDLVWMGKLRNCDIEFEAFLRSLDIRGCKTGHFYQLPDPNKAVASKSLAKRSQVQKTQSLHSSGSSVQSNSSSRASSDNGLEDTEKEVDQESTPRSSQTARNHSKRLNWFSNGNHTDSEIKTNGKLSDHVDGQTKKEIKQLEPSILHAIKQRANQQQERKEDLNKQKRPLKQKKVGEENATPKSKQVKKTSSIKRSSKVTQSSNIMQSSSKTESSSETSVNSLVKLSSQNYNQNEYQPVASKGLQSEETQQITVANHNWDSMRSNVFEMESFALHLRLGHEYQIKALHDVENARYELMVVRKDNETKSILNTSHSNPPISNTNMVTANVMEKKNQSMVNEQVTTMSTVKESHSINENISFQQQQLLASEEMIAVSAVQQDYSVNEEADNFLRGPENTQSSFYLPTGHVKVKKEAFLKSSNDHGKYSVTRGEMVPEVSDTTATDRETEDERQFTSPRESLISTGTEVTSDSDDATDSTDENHEIRKRYEYNDGDAIYAGELSISLKKKQKERKLVNKMKSIGKRAKNLVTKKKSKVEKAQEDEELTTNGEPPMGIAGVNLSSRDQYDGQPSPTDVERQGENNPNAQINISMDVHVGENQPKLPKGLSPAINDNNNVVPSAMTITEEAAQVGGQARFNPSLNVGYESLGSLDPQSPIARAKISNDLPITDHVANRGIDGDFHINTTNPVQVNLTKSPKMADRESLPKPTQIEMSMHAKANPNIDLDHHSIAKDDKDRKNIYAFQVESEKPSEVKAQPLVRPVIGVDGKGMKSVVEKSTPEIASQDYSSGSSPSLHRNDLDNTSVNLSWDGSIIHDNVSIAPDIAIDSTSRDFNSENGPSDKEEKKSDTVAMPKTDDDGGNSKISASINLDNMKKPDGAEYSNLVFIRNGNDELIPAGTIHEISSATHSEHLPDGNQTADDDREPIYYNVDSDPIYYKSNGDPIYYNDDSDPIYYTADSEPEEQEINVELKGQITPNFSNRPLPLSAAIDQDRHLSKGDADATENIYEPIDIHSKPEAAVEMDGDNIDGDKKKKKKSSIAKMANRLFKRLSRKDVREVEAEAEEMGNSHHELAGKNVRGLDEVDQPNEPGSPDTAPQSPSTQADLHPFHSASENNQANVYLSYPDQAVASPKMTGQIGASIESKQNSNLAMDNNMTQDASSSARPLTISTPKMTGQIGASIESKQNSNLAMDNNMTQDASSSARPLTISTPKMTGQIGASIKSKQNSNLAMDDNMTQDASSSARPLTISAKFSSNIHADSHNTPEKPNLPDQTISKPNGEAMNLPVSTRVRSLGKKESHPFHSNTNIEVKNPYKIATPESIESLPASQPTQDSTPSIVQDEKPLGSAIIQGQSLPSDHLGTLGSSIKIKNANAKQDPAALDIKATASISHASDNMTDSNLGKENDAKIGEKSTLSMGNPSLSVNIGMDSNPPLADAVISDSSSDEEGSVSKNVRYSQNIDSMAKSFLDGASF
ncbi:Beta-adducin [Trichoplax sp. H2]|nr:Beta-adducin [Trichoplax sp. H2]|eukprot:RDD43560.1 Beta-adducin [Trichoplax sp. H2]